MEDIDMSVLATQTGFMTIALRLTAAAALGLLIGLDREYHSRPAGLRTHMLISLAAATFAVLTFEIVEQIQQDSHGVTTDPVRIIEAVTAGVAFLAAGTIIRAKGGVQGLTTGAGMWLAGAVGLACGIGAYVVAAFAAGLGISILTLLGWIERRWERMRE